MMNKILTDLCYFEFHKGNTQHGPVPVTWYVIEADSMGEEGRCFTPAEEKEFFDFMSKYPLNFPVGRKNVSLCSEEEYTPSCDIYSNIPIPGNNSPVNLVLREIPQLSVSGEFTKCMDIRLTDANGSPNHHYDLDFDVVGVIN